MLNKKVSKKQNVVYFEEDSFIQEAKASKSLYILFGLLFFGLLIAGSATSFYYENKTTSTITTESSLTNETSTSSLK